MQIFPIQKQSWFAFKALLLKWSQLQTLKQLSWDVLREDKASATVAEAERDFNGGFPKQRSATSYANKRAAMQLWNLGVFLLEGNNLEEENEWMGSREALLKMRFSLCIYKGEKCSLFYCRKEQKKKGKGWGGFNKRIN